MKKLTIQAWLTAIAFASLTFLSCGSEDKNQSVKINTPEEVKTAKQNAPATADASFVDGMTGKVFHNYLQLKMALVNSDADGAKTAAGNLAESFTEERAALKTTANQIAETDDLEKQRELFFKFTAQVEPLIKDGLTEGTIYKQFCPMAFDNQGASWFSDVSEIRNPYFGDKMLKCGKVEETIEKK